MKFTKKAQAGVLIAAVVSVVAVVGLFLVSSGSQTTGAPVMRGVSQDVMYRDYGLRNDIETTGWNLGMQLGYQDYQGNQQNRLCITECGRQCDQLYPDNNGNDVSVCSESCKSACEKASLERYSTGGYYSP